MKASKFSLHSERCWLNDLLQPASILVEAGKIHDIKSGKFTGWDCESHECGHNVLMPGVIDAHLHINEPGRTDWEGFDTATQAAAAGGITTLVDMPLNSSPVTTTEEAFQQKKQAATNKLHVNCGFWGGLIPDNIQHLRSIIEAGCLGIKAFLIHSGIDEFPNVSRGHLEEAMPIIAEYDVPLLVHCELAYSEPSDLIKANPTSYQAYLNSRPKSMENAAIRMMIELCEKYNCHTHIVHLSSAEMLDEIRAAKAKGLPLTVETCPHYIYFNAEEIPDANPLFKCAPPIREKSNNDKLSAAVAEGLIDFIASDHSPAPPAIKALDSGNLQEAWGGISSLQFLLPASWTALRDVLSLEQFIPLLTSRPADFIGMGYRKGQLVRGYDADITVWDPNVIFKVEKEMIRYRHAISPYVGEHLYGEVKKTVVGGLVVCDTYVDSSYHWGQIIVRSN